MMEPQFKAANAARLKSDQKIQIITISNVLQEAFSILIHDDMHFTGAGL